MNLPAHLTEQFELLNWVDGSINIKYKDTGGKVTFRVLPNYDVYDGGGANKLDEHLETGVYYRAHNMGGLLTHFQKCGDVPSQSSWSTINGLPPIGTECIYNFMGEFEEPCILAGVHETMVWLKVDNGSASKTLRIADVTFKPLPTE